MFKNDSKELKSLNEAILNVVAGRVQEDLEQVDEASPRHLKKLVGIARDTNDEDEHSRALGHIEKIAGKKVASQVAKTGKPKYRMLKKGYTSLTPSDRKSSSEVGTKKFKKDTLKRLGQHAKAMKGKLPEEFTEELSSYILEGIQNGMSAIDLAESIIEIFE